VATQAADASQPPAGRGGCAHRPGPGRRGQVRRRAPQGTRALTAVGAGACRHRPPSRVKHAVSGRYRCPFAVHFQRPTNRIGRCVGHG
jgi:hypothetical protein